MLEILISDFENFSQEDRIAAMDQFEKQEARLVTGEVETEAIRALALGGFVADVENVTDGKKKEIFRDIEEDTSVND